MFALLAGLGILTVALFPLALPGLLIFVVAPLILLLAVGALLALPLVLPLGLVRTVLRLRSRRRERAADGCTSAVPAVC
jgi:hypothetical protein